jgi:hypothetical protein
MKVAQILALICIAKAKLAWKTIMDSLEWISADNRFMLNTDTRICLLRGHRSDSMSFVFFRRFFGVNFSDLLKKKPSLITRIVNCGGADTYTLFLKRGNASDYLFRFFFPSDDGKGPVFREDRLLGLFSHLPPEMHREASVRFLSMAMASALGVNFRLEGDPLERRRISHNGRPLLEFRKDDDTLILANYLFSPRYARKDDTLSCYIKSPSFLLHAVLLYFLDADHQLRFFYDVLYDLVKPDKVLLEKYFVPAGRDPEERPRDAVLRAIKPRCSYSMNVSFLPGKSEVRTHLEARPEGIVLNLFNFLLFNASSRAFSTRHLRDLRFSSAYSTPLLEFYSRKTAVTSSSDVIAREWKKVIASPGRRRDIEYYQYIQGHRSVKMLKAGYLNLLALMHALIGGGEDVLSESMAELERKLREDTHVPFSKIKKKFKFILKALLKRVCPIEVGIELRNMHVRHYEGGRKRDIVGQIELMRSDGTVLVLSNYDMSSKANNFIMGVSVEEGLSQALARALSEKSIRIHLAAELYLALRPEEPTSSAVFEGLCRTRTMFFFVGDMGSRSLLLKMADSLCAMLACRQDKGVRSVLHHIIHYFVSIDTYYSDRCIPFIALRSELQKKYKDELQSSDSLEANILESIIKAGHINTLCHFITKKNKAFSRYIIRRNLLTTDLVGELIRNEKHRAIERLSSEIFTGRSIADMLSFLLMALASRNLGLIKLFLDPLPSDLPEPPVVDPSTSTLSLQFLRRIPENTFDKVELSKLLFIILYYADEDSCSELSISFFNANREKIGDEMLLYLVKRCRRPELYKFYIYLRDCIYTGHENIRRELRTVIDTTMLEEELYYPRRLRANQERRPSSCYAIVLPSSSSSNSPETNTYDSIRSSLFNQGGCAGPSTGNTPAACPDLKEDADQVFSHTESNTRSSAALGTHSVPRVPRKTLGPATSKGEFPSFSRCVNELARAFEIRTHSTAANARSLVYSH